MQKPKKRVVFYQGSFDLFHWGHIRGIKKAKSFGDYLIVGVNSDKLYRKYKKKIPVIPFKYRIKTIEALKDVDKAIKIDDFLPTKYLKRYKPDIYVISKEWTDSRGSDIEYMEKIGGRVMVIPYLKTISSTEIRAKIVKNYLDHNKTYCAECHKKL